MCSDTLGEASDIIIKQKHQQAVCFFSFIGLSPFFFSNIKKHKVKVKVARPSLACATDET